MSSVSAKAKAKDKPKAKAQTKGKAKPKAKPSLTCQARQISLTSWNLPEEQMEAKDTKSAQEISKLKAGHRALLGSTYGWSLWIAAASHFKGGGGKGVSGIMLLARAPERIVPQE